LVHGSGNIEIEIEKLLDHALAGGMKKIAIFYPDDELGREQCFYATNLLQQLRVPAVATESYDPKNPKIFKVADRLIEKNPDGVICLSSYMPTTRLMSRVYRRKGWSISFIGLDMSCYAGKILQSLPDLKFKYCSFMPSIEQPNYEIVEEYVTNMKKYFPNEELSVFGLAYYINATLIVRALQRIDWPIARTDIKEHLLDQIEKMKAEDLGGFVADFNFNTRQAYPLEPNIFRGFNVGKVRASA
jgi:ABC-type branched-subunit amino acid transport system substrate-binding protein